MKQYIHSYMVFDYVYPFVLGNPKVVEKMSYQSASCVNILGNIYVI